MPPLYESNHIIIVSKWSGEIVQGDKIGDEPLLETVRQYIKEKYHKSGNVFSGVVHRLDHPVWGLIVSARTFKALVRLNRMFEEGQVHKTYWATIKNAPSVEEDVLTDWLVRNERQNKSYTHPQKVPDAEKAIPKYRVIARSDHHHLIEVNSLTGRHHQICCQLADVGCAARGDLKYGVSRNNPDGDIGLLARRIMLVHPVSKGNIVVEALLPPNGKLWEVLMSTVIS